MLLKRRRAGTAAVLALIATGMLQAGALVLELNRVEENSEASGMHALLVARVSACREPAKSVVSANLLRVEEGKLARVPLKVVRLAADGMFAFTGSIPAATAAIEVVVTNPEYGNYAPAAIVRYDRDGIRWTSLRQFRNGSPTMADVKALM